MLICVECGRPVRQVEWGAVATFSCRCGTLSFTSPGTLSGHPMWVGCWNWAPPRGTWRIQRVAVLPGKGQLAYAHRTRGFMPEDPLDDEALELLEREGPEAAVDAAMRESDVAEVLES